MNRIASLHALGQSLWYDNIERRLLENGELAALVERGDIRGVTSNPSIFHNAIAKSHDYDAALKTMAWAGCSTEQIFDQLAVEDIRAAADLFHPLYEKTLGGDGYVSLEVSPTLAHKADETLAEAKRLWQLVDRPNLMIKIPATLEGLQAVRQAIAAGLNVNVTLIFSLERYALVMEAYLSGLEDRLASGGRIDQIASVASFFISRMDSMVDKKLEAILKDGGKRAEQAKALLGKSAIANARQAYADFLDVFGSSRFARLKEQGARLQRPLWASTSTKNPSYPDTLYVEDLIGPDSVNTVPPQTLDAFRDHGKARATIQNDLPAARQVFTALEALGISVSQVTSDLEKEGVKSFADAFAQMLQTIEQRRAAAVQELGFLAPAIPVRVSKLEKAQAARRMHAIDPTLWTEDPVGQAEIQKRLGWLGLPQSSRAFISEYAAFAEELRADGFTHALLLGMGGSSLAPEVLRLVFGVAGLDLAILDSTDPAQVQAAARRSPVAHTLYIVSSKSGGTAEVNAFLDYFWTRTGRVLGKRNTGKHFIAITDPGTKLMDLAVERKFRHVFHADPMVGGRYSALTAFGLVPAALLGVDVNGLLTRAQWMADQCAAVVPARRNPGLVLGAVMGEAALQGRDKLTLLADPELSSVGAWLEQLIAESCGKQGKGIVPVDGEPLAALRYYGQDRLFVYLRRSGKHDEMVTRLQQVGHPAIVYDIPTNVDLGAEFYRWEVATALACAVLEVNPFDQPDVQDSKTRTIQKIQQYKEHGALDEGQPIWEGAGMRVYGADGEKHGSLNEILKNFLQQTTLGDYIAVNAYLPRNRNNIARLSKLRVALMKQTRLATTVGFGPRFLHSTGQLHKGGADNGVFLQITADPVDDVTIPEQRITFSALERAQSLGDLEALMARGRRVLRVHLSSPADLTLLVEAVKNIR